jgi:hypothetical protein
MTMCLGSPCRRWLAVGTLLGTLLTCVAVGLAAPPTALPAVEVLIEGGAVWPGGDLGADYQPGRIGFQAGAGYTVGFRVRWYLKSDLSLSPGFSFSDFGNYSEELDGQLAFTLETAIIRYTLDVQWIYGRGGRGPRPLLSAGIGFRRNRYGVTIVSPPDDYAESVNTLGFDLGAGVRWGMFELLVVYELNRFSTYRFVDRDDRTDYNWDNVQLRLAWAFPTARSD